MEKQKILVTGGAGFVGSLLVPELLKVGYPVNVLDWFIFKKDLFKRFKNSRLNCMVGDIRHQETVKRSLDGVDIVIHLAAISNDPSSELNPDATKRINLEAVCNLADTAKTAGVKRFINASSASVYGIQKGKPSSEDTEPNPITLYSMCKLDSEKYILSLNSPGFTTTSLRPATLSGYSPRLRLDLTVNILTYLAVCKQVVTVFGGEQYRPNLSVKDMVRAYLLFLTCESTKIGGRAFNVSHSNFKVIEIAEEIQRTLDKKNVRIEKTPSDDKRSYSLDASRITEVLGFKPIYDIDDSIIELSGRLTDGTITSPSDAVYRNVEFLRGIDFAKPLMGGMS